jgi:hypothetical protein
MDPELKDDLVDDIGDDETDIDGSIDSDVDDPPADPPADPPPSAKAKAPVAKPPSEKPPVQQTQPPRRDVPLATFLEEKRKFTEALQTEKAEREKLRAELEALKNPPKAPPKFTDDPEGYIAHATKTSAQEVLAKLDEHGKAIGEVSKANTQTAEEKAHGKFLEELGSMEEQYVATAPDYPQALLHVRRIAYAQLKEFHPDATDQQLMQAITQQELQMARQAMAQGRNPHELAYRLAVVNGYKKAAPPAKGKTNGKAPAAKAPVTDPDDGEEVLDPDLTLGRSNGETPVEDDDDVPDPNTVDPFEDAIKEVFKPRRRA